VRQSPGNHFHSVPIVGGVMKLLILSVVSCFSLGACTESPAPLLANIPAEARWVVPSALTPTGSYLNRMVTTDSVIVVAGISELVAYSAKDGAVRWKRTGVPTLVPLVVDDSLIVVLSAGESAAIRLRDGTVAWRSPVPGGAVEIEPVRIGRTALTTNFEGDVFAVDVYTGVVRQVASMTTLAGGPGRVWNFLAIADTALILSQRTNDNGQWLITLTRLDPTSGSVFARAVVPFRLREALATDPAVLRDSILVLALLGRPLAVHSRTAARLWVDTTLNSTRLVERDGLIYAGSGSGDIDVLDLRTGRRVRRSGRNVAGGITDQYPCREGIFFTSGGLWVVADVPGAAPRKLMSDQFTLAYRQGQTLYLSSSTREVALRCS
jgi:outer membrane protein assembly factor BamB